MKKLYVITSYSGRTDEEIAEIREALRERVEAAIGEETVLLEPTPGLKRVSSEVDGVMKADIVMLSKGFEYSMPSRVVHFAASSYLGADMHEEDWLDGLEQFNAEEAAAWEEYRKTLDPDIQDDDFGGSSIGQEVQDESVPA